MPRKPKKQTRSAGVTLELPVLDYLTALAEREERDRSFCINRIVREHAARHGTPLPPAFEPAPPPPQEP
jgi:hypothetical protein